MGADARCCNLGETMGLLHFLQSQFGEMLGQCRWAWWLKEVGLPFPLLWQASPLGALSSSPSAGAVYSGSGES